MKTFNQFHDGSIDGLLIEGAKVHIFLTTEGCKAFVLELGGVLSLKADGFRQGSSIFDVLVREGGELTSDDMVELFGFTDASKAHLKLEQTLKENLSIVEVNPSYGASCLILAGSVELISKQEWINRFLREEDSE